MHKLNGINAGITIRGLTSPARLEPGEPRDVSLRILFARQELGEPRDVSLRILFARQELGEPRDVSLRILFAQSIVIPQNLPMGA